jgi:transaldolase
MNRMSKQIEQLTKLGQSVWYDNIERRLLENGDLADMIVRGEIQGLTSNPSIFKNAIANSTDYDAELPQLTAAGKSPAEVVEALMVADIQAAADFLHSLYVRTNGLDGYASLEVSPALAYESTITVSEALRLWQLVDRPNLMIKIPATKEGLPAIRQVIAAGVNVNVTLIFSISRYREVVDAYLSGLEDRAAAGQPVDHVASVASFFVSRIDSKVDEALTAVNNPAATDLLGQTAIANARIAYQAFKEITASDRFQALAAKGAKVQRPLWASTSTKNPAYPDTLYVDELIGPHTVNTIPPKTLAAFIDHGTAALTLETKLATAADLFLALVALGISLPDITQQLEDEGVKSFADAFTDLLQAVADRLPTVA